MLRTIDLRFGSKELCMGLSACFLVSGYAFILNMAMPRSRRDKPYGTRVPCATSGDFKLQGDASVILWLLHIHVIGTVVGVQTDRESAKLSYHFVIVTRTGVLSGASRREEPHKAIGTCEKPRKSCKDVSDTPLKSCGTLLSQPSGLGVQRRDAVSHEDLACLGLSRKRCSNRVGKSRWG